jgi:hypothetical protein
MKKNQVYKLSLKILSVGSNQTENNLLKIRLKNQKNSELP